jgi:hypothetical protein
MVSKAENGGTKKWSTVWMTPLVASYRKNFFSTYERLLLEENKMGRIEK